MSIIGRVAELSRLESAFAAATAGRGAVVLIGGEAGIGKTSLVSEVAVRAATTGAAVLTGHCTALAGAGFPYFPVVQAARCGGALAPAPIRTGADPGAAATELLAWVTGRAGAAVVLLVLEDVHDADMSTLDLLRVLADRVGGTRLLVLATFRGDELGRAVANRLRRVGRARTATTLTIPPLGDAQLRELLAARATGYVVPGRTVDAIVARSAGNPFFAGELLAAAVRGDRGLPGTIRHALARQVARLGAEGRALLPVVAAAGRAIPCRLLAEVVAAPTAVVGRGLRQAVGCRVLVVDAAAGTVRFRHALLAEAAYTTLTPEARKEVHHRLAVALAGRTGDAPAAGELARHWAIAGRPALALEASVRAAAEPAVDPAGALGHLERALELWPQVPDAADRVRTDRAAVLAWAAELADLAGQGARAVQLIREAIAGLPAAERVRAGRYHERLGSYLLPLGHRTAGLAAFSRAVELVPGAPPTPARAQVLAALGNALALCWRHADSRRVCEEALAVAGAVPGTAGRGVVGSALRARNVLGLDLCYLGRPDRAVAVLRRAGADAATHGSPREVAHNAVMLCDVLVTSGRLAEAKAVAGEALAHAQRSGLEPGYGVLLAGYAAEVALETGDWAGADELLRRALGLGTSYWTHYPHLLRAQLAVGQGELTLAGRHLAAAAPAAGEPASAARHARVRAELALGSGHPDDALDAIEAGLAQAAPIEAAVHRIRLCAVGLRAFADLAAGPGADAGRAGRDRLRSEAERAAGHAATVTAEATAWHALALAEHGRTERTGAGAPSAAGRWRTALAAWHRLGRPYHAAYCRWRLAEALLATGRPSSAATAHARHSHRTARRLAAQPLIGALDLLARRHRIDLVGVQPRLAAALAGSLGLTPREGEVLTLVASGYTNGEIARELAISAKTTSVHVSHILRKLGVANRAEAAAAAHRRRAPAI